MERFLFRKVELWLILVFIILLIPSISLYGWLVLYKTSGGKKAGVIADAAVAIAEFPGPLLRLAAGKAVLQPQLQDFDEFQNLKVEDKSFNDNGYLLVSAFNRAHGVTTPYLYDLSTQKKLYEWVPPVEKINEQTRHFGPYNLKRNYRSQHPMLMANGDLVMTSGEGPLVRIDRCGGLVWSIDRHFHHTIERAANGNFLVPHVMESKEALKGMASPLRDDGWAEVSPEGKIIKEWSVTRILLKNGYSWLLHGVGPYEEDRIHLNDAEPILESDTFVKRGDVVLSARNISTVFLYRPETDEIIWLKSGPWLNQHDVDYIGNGQFIIFGNDIVRGAEVNDSQLTSRGNTVWKYDSSTGNVDPMFVLHKLGIHTEFQGLQTFLPNGDVFVEETLPGKLHRVSPNGIRWSYVSTIDAGTIGALHWSRYLDRDETKLEWLKQPNCK